MMGRIACALIVAVLCVTLCSCSSETVKKAKGARVVAAVEQFRKERGRLPNSLIEIGIPETERGPVYYEKKSETRFIVWYGKTLGESMTYDSDVGRWEAHN